MDGRGTHDDEVESESDIGILDLSGDERAEISLNESTIIRAEGHRGSGVNLGSTRIAEDSTREGGVLCISFNKQTV